MSSFQPCPICRTAIEDPGVRGLIQGHPELQRTRCPACEVGLIRGSDNREGVWLVEDVDNSPRQCRARLQALADQLDLEFEGPKDSDPEVWRFSLWMKRNPSDPPGQRTARVVGSGDSEREALLSALSDAKCKRLL